MSGTLVVVVAPVSGTDEVVVDAGVSSATGGLGTATTTAFVAGGVASTVSGVDGRASGASAGGGAIGISVAFPSP